ncbi:MAG: hypothetical protein IKP96_01525 [Elusimicrobiaceae bacterium]|nr:hypothetical protein [Elusimicrobiaceae bacterium]
MRKIYILFLLFFCLAQTPYKPVTLRQRPQYLSIDATAVEDSCPGENIFDQFTCSKQEQPGYRCFDVYRVQGDPIDKERYTLLDQTLGTEPTSAEPRCPFQTLSCANFLQALKYNLDFSWFIANFPSSAFPQCSETYSCTRLACLVPAETSTAQNPVSKKLSCVFRKNQTFFVGTEITCQNKNAKSLERL